MSVLKTKVWALEDEIRGISGDVIVVGDFNARAIEWGMPTGNDRGQLLLEMAARLDLMVTNTGRTHTYCRSGFGNSIPDVTFVSARLMIKINGWRVTEHYTVAITSTSFSPSASFPD